jgi:hypothetical protein
MGKKKLDSIPEGISTPTKSFDNKKYKFISPFGKPKKSVPSPPSNAKKKLLAIL